MSLGRWASDLGPTNPIILRIVANGSRRARHLWIRSGFLALLMVALLFGMVGQSASLRDLAQRGAQAFTVLSFVEVTLICVLTPLFMAGAIAQESNPRTWEILLTTPLNRVQIVVRSIQLMDTKQQASPAGESPARQIVQDLKDQMGGEVIDADIPF